MRDVESIRSSDVGARRFCAAGFCVIWARYPTRAGGGTRHRTRRRSKPTRADEGSARISYAEYARYIEQSAGGLYELGVRPGQVVACQLPNWWQGQALLLAATRLEGWWRRS